MAYVAVTRAKQRLMVSGAYWYGLPEPSKKPREPSELFELVDSHTSSDAGGRPDPGERPEILRSPDRTAAPDPLFVDGWAKAIRTAMDDPARIESMADDLGLGDGYRSEMEAVNQRLFHLAEPAGDDPAREKPSLSVTGLVTYSQCPKRFYWSEVDPLPRSRNEAAMRGTELHRRIELHQRGQVPFDDFADDLYDRAPDETGDAMGGFAAYQDSRFAARTADLIEAPFSIELESGQRVRGRIDAIYAEEGRWEVVDFKSGRRDDDPARIVQLQAYALAAREVDFGIPRPGRIDVTFAYLGGGLAEETHHADDEWLDRARSSIASIAGGIEAEDWAPRPGDWCRSCDFLRFCSAGRSRLGE